MAVGAGRWNAARLDGYLAALTARRPRPGRRRRPQLPPGGLETLDDEAIQLEAVSLALRTREGLATDRLSTAGRAALDRCAARRGSSNRLARPASG